MTPHIPTTRVRRRGRALPGPAGPLVGGSRGRGRGVAAFVAALSAAGLTACAADEGSGAAPAPATGASTPAGASSPAGSSAATGSRAPAGRGRVLASGLEAPWGISFLLGKDAPVT